MVNVVKAAEIDLMIGLYREVEELLLMSSLAVWATESMHQHTFLPGYSDNAKYS